MNQKEFEKIVREGIELIPKRFLSKLDNVDICIEKEPPKGRSLFGLYQGIPQTKRRRYGQVLPDKITIFKGPIERVGARSPCPYQKIREIVKKTVWHEIAHHFGLDERRVREVEKRRA